MGSTGGRNSKFGVRFILVALLVSAVSGSLCAAFAVTLDWVTKVRMEHPAFVLVAPLVGLLSVALYRSRSDECARGNDLLIERINQQNGPVPPRMTPLIFATSAAAHLCGASVGREGAAVQIAGGLAGFFQPLLSLPRHCLRPLLQAAIAAGFGAIFGTPFSAAVFAIEAPGSGHHRLRALPLSLLAAFLGDTVCRAWGTQHSHYPRLQPNWLELLNPGFLGAVLLMGLCGGGIARLYIGVTDRLRTLLQKTGRWWFPPLLVGLAIVVLAQFDAASDSLGLGTWSSRPGAVTLSTAFETGGVHPWSWILKLALTALCVSSGFKGGEVTPLFFIGATFGNTLAGSLSLDPTTFAALGFVTVFAAASRTPATGILLGAELFGTGSSPLFAMACLVATVSCGGRTLFPSQKKLEN